jgi:hypothetical protein
MEPFMKKNPHDQQFREVEAAIDLAVDAFVSRINKITGRCGGKRWEIVFASYARDSALLAISAELAKLIDDPPRSDLTGRAHLQLSNALADFRDSRATERYGMWSDLV